MHVLDAEKSNGEFLGVLALSCKLTRSDIRILSHARTHIVPSFARLARAGRRHRLHRATSARLHIHVNETSLRLFAPWFARVGRVKIKLDSFMVYSMPNGSVVRDRLGHPRLRRS